MLKEEIMKVFGGLYKRCDPPSAELNAKELAIILVEKRIAFDLEEMSIVLTELVKEEKLGIKISVFLDEAFVHFKSTGKF